MKLHNVFDVDDEGRFFYGWLFQRDKVLIDNIVFYLHYHVTVALLGVSSLVVVIGTFIMDPIECIADSAVNDVIDNYCLYHSTHTIGDFDDTGNLLLAHPGIPSANSLNHTRKEVRFHNYYLWVAGFLALQAVSFYMARGFWKSWQGNKVGSILEEKDAFLNYAKNNKGKEDSHYLIHYLAEKRHRGYYWKLLGCEFLNLINATLQLFIMDLFLGFGLTKLNYNFLHLLSESQPGERLDTVNQIFPKVTKCIFYNYGSSGSVQTFDSLCVLPVNALNEKIFIIICIWLLVLSFFSVVALVYRLLLLLPTFRTFVMRPHVQVENMDDASLMWLARRLGIDRWQLLCQLCGNNTINSHELTEIVRCTHKAAKKQIERHQFAEYSMT